MKSTNSIGIVALAAMAVASNLGHQVRDRDTLRDGPPESVDMLPGPLDDMVANLTAYTEMRNWTAHSYNQIVPIEPGGVTLIARHGVVVSAFAFGQRLLYSSVASTVGTILPSEDRENTTVDTIYDLASLTKLFTTIAALRQIDNDKIQLNGTVAQYLPEFAANGKDNVTVLQLTTHTSGLFSSPVPPLTSDEYKTYDDRVQAILNQTLVNQPGSTYMYSDLNFMTLGLVLERVTGKKLDELIGEYTEELGMHDTFFNRGNIEGPDFGPWARTASQEFQKLVLGDSEPDRPQPVRGTVHDENAWALDGVSGHAGLFSTVNDTARLCQMILNNGTYGGKRVLSAESVDLIFTNFNEKFPGDDQGVGFELNQFYTAGPMANPLAASHTGFTGTSVVVDRESDTFFLHFANRVHPSRNWASNNIVRESLGYWVAASLGRDVPFPP